MKIRPVRAAMFHEERRMDGQTDITKLIVALRNFANAHKKVCHFWLLKFTALCTPTEPDNLWSKLLCRNKINHWVCKIVFRIQTANLKCFRPIPRSQKWHGV